MTHNAVTIENFHNFSIRSVDDNLKRNAKLKIWLDSCTKSTINGAIFESLDTSRVPEKRGKNSDGKKIPWKIFIENVCRFLLHMRLFVM